MELAVRVVQTARVLLGIDQGLVNTALFTYSKQKVLSRWRVQWKSKGVTPLVSLILQDIPARQIAAPSSF